LRRLEQRIGLLDRVGRPAGKPLLSVVIEPSTQTAFAKRPGKPQSKQPVIFSVRPSPRRFHDVVRCHWSIENSLHWVHDKLLIYLFISILQNKTNFNPAFTSHDDAPGEALTAP
jgi:hypothetical protein